MVSSISMTHTYIEPNSYEGRNTRLLRYTISLFKLDPRIGWRIYINNKAITFSSRYRSSNHLRKLTRYKLTRQTKQEHIYNIIQCFTYADISFFIISLSQVTHIYASTSWVDYYTPSGVASDRSNVYITNRNSLAHAFVDLIKAVRINNQQRVVGDWEHCQNYICMPWFIITNIMEYNNLNLNQMVRIII